MKHFVQSLPFLAIAGFCLHVACSDAVDDGTTSGVGPVGSQGTGFNPACNDDRRDGYCNAFGGDPETCECFDCVQVAMCTGRCNDDGTCNYDPAAGEDCTCADCLGMQDCGPVPMDTTADGPSPESSAETSGPGGGDGGGPATTTAPATTGMGGAGGSGMGGAGGS